MTSRTGIHLMAILPLTQVVADQEKTPIQYWRPFILSTFQLVATLQRSNLVQIKRFRA